MKISSLGHCIALLFSCGLLACGEAEPVEITPPEDISTYARLCGSCHGTLGQGSALGPQIQQPVNGYATWVIRNGRVGNDSFRVSMPDFDTDTLSDGDLDAILDFLSSQPKPTSGEGLYKVYCENCHGDMGSGGAVGENIARDARNDPEELLDAARRGEGGRDYADRGEYMPSWTADELSNEELWLISQYLSGQDNSMPPSWAK